MDGNRSFDEYRMPDVMWDRMKLLLPEYDVNPAGGRPRQDLRRVADAIFYRMRTGCQWKAIPPSLVPGSTAHQYFQQWVQDGVFDSLWQAALTEYDDLVNLLKQFDNKFDGAFVRVSDEPPFEMAARAIQACKSAGYTGVTYVPNPN